MQLGLKAWCSLAACDSEPSWDINILLGVSIVASVANEAWPERSFGILCSAAQAILRQAVPQHLSRRLFMYDLGNCSAHHPDYVPELQRDLRKGRQVQGAMH